MERIRFTPSLIHLFYSPIGIDPTFQPWTYICTYMQVHAFSCQQAAQKEAGVRVWGGGGGGGGAGGANQTNAIINTGDSSLCCCVPSCVLRQSSDITSICPGVTLCG